MPEDSASLLIAAGLVTDEQASAARRHAASHGGTVPEALVLAGSIADEVLTEFFRVHLLVARIAPEHLAAIDTSVIARIPGELAVAKRVVPVGADDHAGTLTVLMSDPGDLRAWEELAAKTGAAVLRATATQQQIAWCLGFYYDFISMVGQTLLTPDEPPSPRPPRRRGLTGQVHQMRRAVIAPAAADDDEASADWIASRTEALKRELAGRGDAAAPPAPTPTIEPDSTGAVTGQVAAPYEESGTESRPILLTKPGGRRRSSRRTAVGLGGLSATPPVASRSQGETPAAEVPYTGAVSESNDENERDRS